MENSSSNDLSCPVCSASGPQVLGCKRGNTLSETFSYQRCEACHYRWVLPFPGYDIYNDAYYQGKGADPYVDYATEYANHAATDRLLEFEDVYRLVCERLKVQPTSGAPLRWLDFGCGAGGLLKFLRQRATIPSGPGSRPLAVAGHDIGTYAERLRDVDGFAIHSLEALKAMEGTFDVVTCIEVAEHVREVQELFQTLGRLVRPGGFLLLTTGNLESPAARLAGLNYRYLIPEIHISLFNPQALEVLYRKNGFEPLCVTYRGVVDFKVVKSVPARLKPAARLLLRFPGVRFLVDRFYGVSAMPCAVKR